MSLPVILYDNRFSDGTPTATDTATGYDVLNIRDLRPYTWWQAASFGTKYVYVDCGTAKSADALGIIGHNLYTANATVSVESSATGAWAGEQTERLAGFVPTSDKAIFKLFSSASARYWRLKIVTAAVAPRLAVVMLGVKLEFPWPPDNPFLPFTETIVAHSERSKGAGHLLGSTIRYKPRDMTIIFSSLLRTFVFGLYQTFWDDWGSDLKPFFWVWDLDVFPTHIFFASFKTEASFGAPMTTSTYVDTLQLDLIAIKEV